MKEGSEIFIRSEFRPDLRARVDYGASDPRLPAVPLPVLPWGSRRQIPDTASFPVLPVFSGCGEKTDKSDKTKEVGKDDKSHREPVKDYQAIARDGFLPGKIPPGGAHATIFA